MISEEDYIMERNVVAGGAAVFFSGMFEYLEPLKWFAIAAVMIVLADLRFGIEAAQFRKEKIRTSRAIRRTINKLVDYCCWILLASAIDHALGEPFQIPLLSAFIMLVVFGVEINSCFSNYFEARGKKINFSIFSLFSKIGNKVEDIKTEDIERPSKKKGKKNED